jgi:hypothetical protein
VFTRSTSSATPILGTHSTIPCSSSTARTGTLLAQDDDNGDGSNSYFQYNFSQPGTYYVAVSGYYLPPTVPVSSHTGDYWFSVTSGDIAGDTTTRADIRVGIPIAGYLDPGIPDSFYPGGRPDHDYYQITLKAGVTYTITMTPNAGTANGPISGPLASPPPYVAVYVTDGVNMSSYGYDESDDQGGPATFQFTPSTTGTYYVVATAPDPFTGNYTLNVNGTVQINHRPSGTSKTITIAEDNAYAFTNADVGYSDTDGNALSAVRIASLPGVGTLSIGSTPLDVGDLVWPTSVKWTPPANFNGTASFTFQVQDSVSATTEQGPTPIRRRSPST